MDDLSFFKKPFFWLSLVLVLVCLVVFSLPDNRLHLIFCDVGQGDATLITYQKTQILIDGGVDNRVLDCLSHHLPFYDRQIEMMVLTHPEEDHFGGLIDVVQRYRLKYFVSNEIKNSTPAFQELEKLKKEKKVISVLAQNNRQLKIGPLVFSVLWPPSDNFSTKSLNDTSVVLELAFGQFKALLTGDISAEVEKQLALKKVEVLKVAHHGSKFSTSKDFLDLIKPKIAVISVGKNKFGHPSKEVLQRLEKAKIISLRTDEKGEIEIVSDGRQWYNSP